LLYCVANAREQCFAKHSSQLTRGDHDGNVAFSYWQYSIVVLYQSRKAIFPLFRLRYV
jgi:hypothetical protein